MKQKLLTTITVMLMIALVSAQVPQGMNYQAVVHDNLGNIIPNQAIGIKFNIRQGGGSGTVVYAETQTPTSDQFGGIALVIGQGAVVSGSFSAINWATGTYFNEVLLDVTGGTNYVSMGASQLMSVPYAFYAKSGGANSYTVKFNGVPITDASINDVTTGGDGNPYTFLTENNYWYKLNRGLNTTGGALLTTDTVSNNALYAGYDQPEDTLWLKGYVSRAFSNITNAFYYIPLNANTTMVGNLYQYDPNTNHYFLRYGPPRPVFQLLPNNPSVTGFNLTFPVNVTIER